MCKKVKHKTTYHACRHIIFLKKKKSNKDYGIRYCDKCQSYHVSTNLNNCEYIINRNGK